MLLLRNKSIARHFQATLLTFRFPTRLAFLTPLLERLLWNADPSKDIGLAVLVVAPGRELASQIVSVARELLEDTGLTVQLAIGGTTFSRNLEQIRKRRSNILVGTPGRIAELVVGKPGEK